MAGEQERDVIELADRRVWAELCLQQHGCIRIECRLHHQPDVCGTRLSEFGWRAAGDEPTTVDDVDLICQCLGFIHVVGGQHDADPVLVEFAQQLPRRTPSSGIHASCGLVDEDEFGPADDCHGQAKSLLLATGQTAIWGASQRLEAEALNQQIYGQWICVQAGHVAQHLDPVHSRPSAALLQHDSDLREQPTAIRLRIEVQDPDGALIRFAISLAGLQSGCLASAVWAKYRGDCMASNGQVEMVDGYLLAVLHDQASNLDGGSNGHATSLGRLRLTLANTLMKLGYPYLKPEIE